MKGSVMYIHKTALGAIVLAITLALSASSASANGTKSFDKAMKPILSEYLDIHKALASDKTSGVVASAKNLVKFTASLAKAKVTGEHAAHYKGLPSKIKKAATVLKSAKTLDAMRAAFKDLSKPMAMWGGMSKPAGIDVVYCSMAKGSWLQKKGTIANPYYGASMSTCGSVVGGASKHTGHKH